ncbi:MAG: M4 family metallopeptidase [Saprospiraceae bacterium]
MKSIRFGQTTVSNNLQHPTVRIPDLITKHTPKAFNSIHINPLSLTGQPMNAVPNTISDPNSFWDKSLKPVSFNLRAANSSVYAFLNQFKTRMRIQDVTKEFEFLTSETDDLQMQHVKVRQLYQGIPVYGGELVLHGKNNNLEQINGIVFPTPIDLNITPDQSLSTVETILVNDLSSLGLYHPVSPALLKLTNRERIKSELVIFHDEFQVPHLAYDIALISGMDIWYYKVDAHSGAILKKYNNTCTFLPRDNHSYLTSKTSSSGVSLSIPSFKSFDFSGKTTSNATDLAGKPLTLNTYLDGSTFFLVDASRQMFKTIGNDNEEPTGVIWTFDGKNLSPAKKTFNPALINSPNNSGWISAGAASAHNNAGLAYEYYQNKHQRNSINGTGGNIISLINITEDDGAQMDNAFWDGAAMYYGNGKDAFTPLAKALDVAGHELSHGVIQSTANLDYDSESGALNESFADIFGRLIDRDDWLIGEDVVKKAIFPTGALRSFIDPHNGGNQLNDNGYQPRTYTERYKGTMDNSGVHINSGINNWAFYQFVTRINNDLDKGEKVYYRALTKYLTRSSRFIDCRKAVIQSATDFFGANSAEVTAAKAAYDMVGILDGASTPTQKDVDTNPGKDFIVYSDNAQTALYLADGAGKILANPLDTVDPLSKPSVTDDGGFVIFVGKDKRIHYIQIDWAKNTFTKDNILQSDPIWRNAIISKNGDRLAAIKDVEENKIHVYDYTIANGEWRVFDLYNPTSASSGIKTGTVDYADAMEFEYTSQEIMYDAHSTIKNATGADIEYWDISFLSVYNGEKATWADGKISKLFSQLPEKTSVGNATFSKNSPHIIAFDMLVESLPDPTYYLLGGNLETGVVDSIFENNDLSWPSYSTSDDRVLFNYEVSASNTILGQIKLDKSKIASAGQGEVLIQKARLGTWFANGNRQLSTATPDAVISKYSASISPNPSHELMTLRWNQPLTPTPNSFVIYDLMGRIQWTFSGKYAQGNQTITIPVEYLSQGMYILKINVEGKAGAIKFMHQ